MRADTQARAHWTGRGKCYQQELPPVSTGRAQTPTAQHPMDQFSFCARPRAEQAPGMSSLKSSPDPLIGKTSLIPFQGRENQGAGTLRDLSEITHLGNKCRGSTGSREGSARAASRQSEIPPRLPKALGQ